MHTTHINYPCVKNVKFLMLNPVLLKVIITFTATSSFASYLRTNGWYPPQSKLILIRETLCRTPCFLTNFATNVLL